MKQLAQEVSVLRFGPFEIDLRAAEVLRNGRRVRLQPLHFKLLTILLERPHEVIGRQELEERLWSGVAVGPGSLGEAVHKLRQKLGDDAATPRYIETVPRMGYKLIAEVERYGTPGPQSASAASRRTSRRMTAALMLGVAAVSALGTFLLQRDADQGEIKEVRRFYLRPDDPIRPPSGPRRKSLSISPDGSYVAWVGTSGSLWIRDLKHEQPIEIQETGAGALFWSPDSRYLLFSSMRGLLKVSAQGGPPAVLCDPDGVMWAGAVAPDGQTVVFAAGALPTLWEVPFEGGTPRRALSEAERKDILSEHFDGARRPLGLFPAFLPREAGERVLMFGIGLPNTPQFRLVLLDMDTRERSLLPVGVEPVYAPSGHLLYQRGTNPVDLWAAPFSLRTKRVEGEAFLVHRSAWSHSVAPDGTLVYADWEANPNELVWRDRSGRKLGSIGSGGDPRISPDGARVAYTLDGDIWTYNSAQEAHRRLTIDHAGDFRPIWSPDAKRLAFSSPRGGDEDVWQISIERAGAAPTLLYGSPEPEVPDHWSLDGKTVAFHASPEQGQWYLGLLTQTEHGGDWKPRKFSDTVGNAMMLAFHPSGKYVAYQSYVTGAGIAEIYVERFPEGGEQVPISSNRGIQARWSADGTELFFIGRFRDQKRTVRDPGMYRVAVKTEPEFSASPPERLFSLSALAYYDVTPDGRRFIISEPSTQPTELGIHVVENWYEEFREQRKAGRQP